MILIGKLLLSLAVSYVLQLFQTKPEGAKPAKFDELDVTQAEEGVVAVRIFGAVDIKRASIVAYGDYRTTEIHDDGGKK